MVSAAFYDLAISCLKGFFEGHTTYISIFYKEYGRIKNRVRKLKQLAQGHRASWKKIIKQENSKSIIWKLEYLSK